MRRQNNQQFKELLILSYFKQHNDYSLVQIANEIGVPLNNLADLIEILIEKGFLERRDDLLSLSFSGRICLQKSSVEFYDYYKYYNDYNNIEEFREKAWDIDRIYIPEDF